MRRASIRLEPFSPVIAARLGVARASLRSEAGRVFQRELRARHLNERRDTLAALEAISAWEIWEVMRVQQNLSIAQARKAIAHAIAAIVRTQRKN